ncbi:hypothetical protein ANN_26255 [Periplaneta americana]|uniref:Reverse transcriptase n=1 Tax=Periplaneta americana TaxID=6978 RepID=A0ABQ8S5E1_PERAM|nr:hypothetical protein ANN_26255 [Periplaneta americana]
MQEKSLYIKVISPTVYEKIVQKHEGETKFKYGNGEQTQIKISKADSPAITVRVFNLPPEVPNSMVTTALTRYGVINSVRNEQWSTAFPFPVNNGIRALKMEVKQNIPGSVPIGGYNAHVTYIGQPILCFVCHEPDHKKEGCRRRKTTLPVSVQSRKLLLSDIVMGRSSQGPSTSKEERTMTRPVERGAPVEDDTDTSSETAEVTNVVTDRTEQPTLETTDRTEDTTAEEVNTDGRNAAPELMETTVIPPESKSASQFGDASLEENSRDPLLRSRDAGPSNAATDKNSPHLNPSSKTKNSPTRPHPYAIYGRTKKSNKKEGAEGKSTQKGNINNTTVEGITDLDMQNDIDVLLLQEVNNDNFEFLGPQYEYVVNTGENNRGTAIIYLAGMDIEQVETHPSGRVISMNINNTQFINVYLPSGTNYRQERENFISKEIPFYLRHRYNRLLIGGDWNCVLHAKDQTGKYNPSPALENLTRELQLMDTWELFHGNDVEYTFRRQNVSSRLDRFYITRLHSIDVYRIQNASKKLKNFFTSFYAASPTSQKATSDILKSVNRHLSLQQQQDLQSPITEEEIRLALEGAPKNTAPGPDGLTYQVYKNHWRLIKEYLIELMNYILDTGSVIDGLSDGVVTLIPKTTNPTTVSEYRPITLLKTDYKLFMKVLANRLKPAFRDIFEIGQTCGVPEKSIIHNLSTIRDTVLYFEEHHNDKEHYSQWTLIRRLTGLIICTYNVSWNVSAYQTKLLASSKTYTELRIPGSKLMDSLRNEYPFKRPYAKDVLKYATVLERAVSFYIWKDYLYKLRKAQLVLPKDKGGSQLIAVKEKCQALITPNIIRGQRGESDPMDNEFWKRHIPL